MDERRRKLSLWSTKTFQPIMTHDELDPIMSNLGFVGLSPKPSSNGVLWREYYYAASTRQRLNSDPKLTLPYPKLDGLHVYTYRAFLDALGFSLRKDDVSEIFHVRTMAISLPYDRMRKYRQMEEESFILYTEGSLDQSTYKLYHADKSVFSTDDDCKAGGYNSMVIRSKDKTVSVGTFVPYKNFFE